MIFLKYKIKTKIIRNNPKTIIRKKRKYTKFRIRISENINLFFFRTKNSEKFPKFSKETLIVITNYIFIK